MNCSSAECEWLRKKKCTLLLAAVQGEENYGAKRSEMVEALQRIRLGVDVGVDRRWRERGGRRRATSGRTDVQKQGRIHGYLSRVWVGRGCI